MDGEVLLSDLLSEFARTMLTEYPAQATLDHLTNRIAEVLPVIAAGVTVVEPDQQIRYISSSSAIALRHEELQVHLGEGPCIHAAEMGRPVLVNSLAEDHPFPEYLRRASALGSIGAVYAFPLRFGGRCLGALDLYRDAAEVLDESTCHIAQTLADVVAAYLVNASARDTLRQRSDIFRLSSLHDSLTGLPNRTLFRERLEHASQRAQRSHSQLAVLFVDLDRFKEINDMHGHRAGDEILIGASRRLRDLVRQGDTVARMAGDEFVVLCEDMNNAADGMILARRITDALSAPFLLDGVEVAVTASVGIAFAGPGDEVPDGVLNDADEAMYQAKRAGGDGHRVLDLHERARRREETALQHDLHVAIEQGQLSLVYQPIVRTRDAEMIAVEALLRWQHPQRGNISPSVFVPLAERSSLIVDIGQWVLQRAASDLRLFRAEAHRQDLRLCVNVSPRQLLAAGFVSTVTRMLAANEPDPQLLTLEITESVFMDDDDRADIVLRELKDIGVHIALDDFGTGYSSLSYLRRFPIDIIKIDSEFITKTTAATREAAIVAATVNLAHALGKIVVAEGVETAEQQQLLADLGCDSCQGFYFSPPVRLADLAMKLAATKPGSW